jgi:hypothetical protein
MNLFKSRATRVAGAFVGLGFAVMLAGCNELADDSYSASFSMRGANGYSVLYSGSVDVELNAQNDVVTLYAIGGGQSKANIKVSGKRHFAVHGCGTLKADNGALVDVYDCDNVKAMPGTTINAINVGKVLAAQGVPVDTHGRSQVQYFKVKDATGSDVESTNDSGLPPVTPGAPQQ